MTESKLRETLKNRFNANMQRHPDIFWDDVESRLNDFPGALLTLLWLENSGGEPDVIGIDPRRGYIFCDCSKETPSGRRSLCYDNEALSKRKKDPPDGSVEEQARLFCADLLTEEMYLKLQSTGEYDLKTSSWIRTPEEIRKQGGALFCERRYGRVFTFHNSADSYYSARGWRGYVIV